MSITLTRMPVGGRHRLGRPGLIPVTALLTVVRRGLFASWLRPGRHRGAASPGNRHVTRPPRCRPSELPSDSPALSS